VSEPIDWASGFVALVCLTEERSAEVTVWDGMVEALAASEELSPCGPRCVMEHSLLQLRGDRLRVSRWPVAQPRRRYTGPARWRRLVSRAHAVPTICPQLQITGVNYC
jgi:hypothetical protein